MKPEKKQSSPDKIGSRQGKPSRERREAHRHHLNQSGQKMTTNQKNERSYVVSLEEEPGDKSRIQFECSAASKEDAADAAESAYPGCVVHTVFEA